MCCEDTQNSSGGFGVAIHPGGHVVTADTAHGAATLGNNRRCVVRAPGTVVGHPFQNGAGARQRCLLRLQECKTLADERAAVIWRDAIRDNPRDARRCEFAGGWQDPIIALVELSDDSRAYIGAPVVELFLDLVFDDGALFLDHQHFFEPFGKLAHNFAVQGPAHSQFQHPQTDLGGQCFIDTEIFQSLAHVQVGFSRGDNADARHRAVDDDLVDGVCPGESNRGVELVLLQTHFLLQGLVGPAHVQATLGEHEVVRGNDVDPPGIDIHRGGGIHGLGNGFKAHPTTAIT